MTTCIITGIVCLFIGTVLGFGMAPSRWRQQTTKETTKPHRSRKTKEVQTMADVDRCVICGQSVPEGTQVCGICKIIAGEGTPDIVAVKEAARVIKRYCNGRNSNPETDCSECPIKDICYNEPYLWEV